MLFRSSLGIDSIGLTAIISVFIGAVITLQMCINLDSPFIPRSLVGYDTRETMILEFSSTVVALILAGKVGSSIASEIGTMRITEQIDALEIMGVNSASYLILPKIVAAVVFFPFLTILSIAIGIIGGWAIAYLTGTGADTLRDMVDKVRDKAPNAVTVLIGSDGNKTMMAVGVSKNALARGLKAGALVKKIAAIAGGNGGGKPDFAMAGIRDTSKIDDALNAVPEIVKAEMNQ